MKNKDIVKKTITEWEKETGVKILDPDGFDRSNPNLYDLEFTKEEFIKGVLGSTIESKWGNCRM